MCLTKMQLVFGGLLGATIALLLLRQQTALVAEQAEQARLLSQQHGSTVPADAVRGEGLRSDEEVMRDRLELERLRSESTKLRAQITEAKERAQASAGARPGPNSAIAVATDVIRRTEVHDAGQGTPAALVQTAMWAVLHGDTNRLYELMAFDAGIDAEKLQQQMRSIRDEFEREGPLSLMTNGPAEVRILREQLGDNNDHWIVTSETHSDGSTGKPERVRIRWTDTGWRLVIGRDGLPISESVEEQP